MSATYSVPRLMAEPLGAFSVTPPTPPSIHFSASTLPSGETREMNPLLSLASPPPLMLDTR